MKFTKNNPSKTESIAATEAQKPFNSFKAIKPKRYSNFEDDATEWIKASELIGATFFIHRITKGIDPASKAPKLYYKISLNTPESELRKFSTASNENREMMMADLDEARSENRFAVFGPMTIIEKELTGGRTFYDICTIGEDVAPF